MGGCLKRFGKWILIGVGLLFACGIIASVINGVERAAMTPEQRAAADAKSTTEAISAKSTTAAGAAADAAKSTSRAATEAAKPTDAPTPTPSAEEQLNTKVKAAFRLGKVEKVERSGGILTVTYQLADLDESSAVFSAIDALSRVPRVAFEDESVKKVSLIGTGMFKDKYGALSEDDGIRMFITRELGTKIQWDNVTGVDVAKLLLARELKSDVWIHPAFRSAWAAKLSIVL